MKITDIVLVTENWKGTEKNCLMTAEDYFMYLDLDTFDSRKDLADSMLELGKTLGNENDWSEYYFASNKSVYARFCTDEEQLKKFLEGFYNSTDQKVSFDKGMCSGECLDKLSELCMDTRGNVNIFALSYTEAYSDFEQGMILHNFNGSDYRVMEKLSAKNLLLQDERTGNFVVALGVSLFARHPKGTEAKEGNCQIGIEWGHGVYLGSTPSAIDFRHIRQEYGTEKTAENIHEYREMLQDRFRMYSNLSEDKVLSEKVREAVMYARYDEFGTNDRYEFRERLNAGRYDRGFEKMKQEEREKSR